MNDLYYESHNHAAVMFASIIFDEVYTEDEMAFLKLMNQYITIMDTVSTSYSWQRCFCSCRFISVDQPQGFLQSGKNQNSQVDLYGRLRSDCQR